MQAGRWPELISTHAPLAGSDSCVIHPCQAFPQFQPTLPSRGATSNSPTHLPQPQISTHAPLAGSDPPAHLLIPDSRPISTHAPLAGSDRFFHCDDSRHQYFNPRSPRGERRQAVDLPAILSVISTHAPLAGSDQIFVYSSMHTTSFQPTLPSRGATKGKRREVGCMVFQPTLPSRGATATGSSAPPLTAISTHAPLAGSDAFADLRVFAAGDFNPRSPRGERLEGRMRQIAAQRFQPTLPSRGATLLPALLHFHAPRISTHAPLAGSDRIDHVVSLPRSISTHAPLAGSDFVLRRVFRQAFGFQPTLPSRGATRASTRAWRACR